MPPGLASVPSIKSYIHQHTRTRKRDNVSTHTQHRAQKDTGNVSLLRGVRRVACEGHVDESSASSSSSRQKWFIGVNAVYIVTCSHSTGADAIATLAAESLLLVR